MRMLTMERLILIYEIARYYPDLSRIYYSLPRT
jgi:hypothetical protein